MIQQLHGTGPASSTPDDSNDRDGDGGEAHILPTGPGLGPGPGEAACPSRWEDRPLGLPPLPSFSSFARTQHQNLQSRPRIRRRDEKSSAQKHKSTTKSSSTRTPAQPSPLGPSIVQAQSPISHHSEPRQRQRPYPLRDPEVEELSTLSPPLLPSLPIYAPPSAESHKDIAQLADRFSRHRLELAVHHSNGRTAKRPTPTNAGENPGRFNYRMSDLCLRGGGNEPVSDLEVDMACDSQENTSSNDMHLPSQGVSVSTHQVRSPSSCDFASHHDKPLPSSRGTALTAASALSVAQSRTLLADSSRQEPVFIGTESDSFPACVPLSPEFLALPHHAPIHDDVPSSGYDMKGWLESSGTVEAPPCVAAGAIGSDTMTSAFFTAVAQARTSPRTRSNTHLQRPSPLKRVHAPQQLLSSYLDSGRVDLANGSSLPVADVEVAMTGNEDSNHNPIDEIVPNTPEALEAFQRELSPSVSSTDGALGSVLASYSRLRSSRSGAEADGRQVPLSQRIHMARMQVERDVMFRQAGFVTDGASAREMPACNDAMDVEMKEPTILGLSSGGASGMDGPWVKYALSLRPESEQDDVRRHMGRLRSRLCSDGAMRCTNLVYSKPRMRRRRLGTDSKAATPAGSVSSMSAKDASVGDGTEAESTQSNEKEWQQPSSTRDRKSKLGRRREMSRQSSRNLLVHQTRVQAGYEVDARVPEANAVYEQPCPVIGQLALPPPKLDASYPTDSPSQTMP